VTASFILIDPGTKLFGRERRERQQQIAEIPLRIDHQRRNAIDCRFLQQIDTQAGLTAARHPDTDRVRHQIFRVVQHVRSRRHVLAGGLAEIKESKLLVCLHVIASNVLILFRHYRQSVA
jgi:hypothetical protein